MNQIISELIVAVTQWLQVDTLHKQKILGLEGESLPKHLPLPLQLPEDPNVIRRLNKHVRADLHRKMAAVARRHELPIKRQIFINEISDYKLKSQTWTIELSRAVKNGFLKKIPGDGPAGTEYTVGPSA